MTRKCGWFGLALLVQLVLLAAVPWGRTSEGAGRTLWLEATALRRDDPMQGHYLELDYAISTPASLTRTNDWGRGEGVFVVLRQAPDGMWKAIRTEPELPPEIPQDQVVIRGTTVDRFVPLRVQFHERADGSWEADSVLVGREPSRPRDGKQQTVARARVHTPAIAYGIESYFVPEGQRERLEEDLRRHPTEVATQVRVDEGGRAILLKLRIQDRVYDL